MMLWIRRTAW
jgi:hypothetical protein